MLNEIRDQLRPLSGLTREEIEKRINELTRKYVETGDKEIIKKLDELSLELEKLEKNLNCRPFHRSILQSSRP